jgi:hypothetical protein
VAAAGAPVAFLINAVSYLALIVVLIGWKRPKTERRLPAERLAPAILAGLRYASLSPVVSRVLVRTLLFNVAGSAVWGLMPLLARDVLHGGAATYGLLFGSLGAGAVLGAMSSAWLRERWSPEFIVRGAGLVFAAGVGVAAASPWLPLTIAAMVAGGAGWILTVSSFNISVQSFSAGWVVGRCMALFQTCMGGGLALGSWAWGHVAEGNGVQVALAFSAAASAATALIGLRWPAPSLDHRPDFAPNRLGPPSPAVQVEPSRGVITVSAEYRVAETQIPAFLAAMAEKRRIRTRDGARRWTLMQDLADPEVWLEKFDSPNWTEHLRQRHRITKADHVIEQCVRDLHVGDEPPRVRRFIERLPVDAGDGRKAIVRPS